MSTTPTHSPEPWKYRETMPGHLQELVDANGKCLAFAQPDEWAIRPVDAERIVACVNACRGLPIAHLLDIAACRQSEADAAGGAGGRQRLDGGER